MIDTVMFRCLDTANERSNYGIHSGNSKCHLHWRSGDCKMLNCFWCGSKGGIVNKLLLTLVPDFEETALVECEWCAKRIAYEAINDKIQKGKKK